MKHARIDKMFFPFLLKNDDCPSLQVVIGNNIANVSLWQTSMVATPFFCKK